MSDLTLVDLVINGRLVKAHKFVLYEVEMLRNENERLRGALENILLRVKNPAIHYKSDLINIIFDMEKIAQKALEGRRDPRPTPPGGNNGP